MRLPHAGELAGAQRRRARNGAFLDLRRGFEQLKYAGMPLQLLAAGMWLWAARASAAPEPRGRAASLIPVAATPVFVKAQKAEFEFDAEARGFRVSVRTELATTSAIDVQLALPEYACDADAALDDDC